MGNQENEKPALLIIDMVKDNFIESKKLPITPFAINIIAPLNRFDPCIQETSMAGCVFNRCVSPGGLYF